VRGLTLIVTNPASFRAALELTAANAALGGRARIFLQGATVVALDPLRDPHDVDHTACGLPTLPELFDAALELGVEIIACQSGLLLMGLTADTLDARITYGGPVSVLQTIEDDRLAAV
jgi:predicted peroxiredoxin